MLRLGMQDQHEHACCADATLLPPGRQYRLAGTVAVTFRDGQQQGMQHPEGTAQLGNLAVDPKMRRLGIARLLLESAEQHARAQGAAALSLAVHVDNAPARSLYVCAGYREDSSQGPLQTLVRLARREKLVVMRKPMATQP